MPQFFTFSFARGCVLQAQMGFLNSVTFLVFSFFFLLYFGCPEACRIPDQGWNPQLLEWKCSLNHWTAREVPSCFDQLWPCSKILPCSKLLPFLGPFAVVSFEDVSQGPRFPHALRGCWTRQLCSNGSVQFGRSVVSASL